MTGRGHSSSDALSTSRNLDEDLIFPLVRVDSGQILQDLLDLDDCASVPTHHVYTTPTHTPSKTTTFVSGYTNVDAGVPRECRTA